MRALLAGVAALLALPAAASALPPFTTAAKTSPPSGGGQSEVYRIDAGCHPGFDRFVIRVRSSRPGYDVRYVNRIVEDGSGNPVSLLGTRRIRVLVRDARAHTESGGVLLAPRTLTPGCSNLRQVKLAGDFEGVVTFGLGLRRRAGFRVFRLTGPSRIVIDVAH